MKTPNAKHRRAVYAVLDSNRCKWWRPSDIALAHSLRRCEDPALPVLTLHDVGLVLQWYAVQGFAVGSGFGSYQYRYQSPKSDRDAAPEPCTDMTVCV